MKTVQRELGAVGGWVVSYAGKTNFDPRDPRFAENPDAICALAPTVETDHPLYVLRRVNERLALIRAFEPGNDSRWQKCAEVESTNSGYLFGEPLYHVFSKGKFIDVQSELEEIAKRAGLDKSDKRLANIPLFSSNAGK